jgi:hypothetical protein
MAAINPFIRMGSLYFFWQIELLNIAAHVISRQWHVWGAERRSLGVLCEISKAAHLRFSNKSRSTPITTTTNTTMMLHGVDEVGLLLGVDVFTFASGVLGIVGCTIGGGLGVGVVCGVDTVPVVNALTAALRVRYSICFSASCSSARLC